MSAIETKQLKLFGVHTDNTKLPLIPNLKINWLSRSTNLINISSTGNISGTNQNGRTFIIATIDSFGLVDSIPVVVIDTFVNASFELPAISGYQYLPTGSGWIFSGGAGIQKNGSAFQSATAPHGVQTAFLQSIGQISQNVLFESGSYYIIFNASRRTSLGGQQTVNVRLDSTLLLGTFAPVTGDFIQCTTSIFNTVTATHFLTFAGTNGSGDNTAFIDNIRIVRVQSTGQENCNEEFVKTSISIAPNPFNPVTSIHFKLNEITGAEFSIYNANGTFIRKFLIPRGIRNGALVWDGRDSRGKCGSAGLYIGKLKTNGKAILLSRLLLLK
ncbi:MAG: T9SS type A sorting domain-containing protein [Fibrobacteres bacterium]|nr:T9SS type A sorting domain-containing protein [Fibrobacterota bacterium]